MVMCHNGKSMGHIANCLEELIGKDDAVAFANWSVVLHIVALRNCFGSTLLTLAAAVRKE